MLDGPSVVVAFTSCGITDVVWIPDSELGRWDADLRRASNLRLIRVCREGEAIAVAGGLCLGGRKPIVLIQCTGLFEAGDSLRNLIHDFKLPLFFIIGVRSYLARQKDGDACVDTCPIYTEPILKAWGLPYVWLDKDATAGQLAAAYRLAQAEGRAGAVLLPE